MSGMIPLMDEDGQRLYLNSMLSSPELFARKQFNFTEIF